MHYFRGRRTTTSSTMIMAASILLLLTISLSSSLATTGAVADTGLTATRRNNSTCKRGTMPTKLAANCWKAMFEVPICIFEIVKVYEGGSKFDMGKPCCRAFVDLAADCKIEVFHHHVKLFPGMEGFCKAVIVADPIVGRRGKAAPPPHPALDR